MPGLPAEEPAAGPAAATVIGGVAWNLLVEVPRLPTDLTTLHATAHRYGVGGTGAGKAMHLARLGFATQLHALIGDDEPGTAVRRELDEAGVVPTFWTDPAGTEQHLNLMEPHGDRVSIFLIHATPDPDIPADSLARLTERVDQVFVSLTHYSRRVLPLLTLAGVRTWVDLHDWDGGPSDFHQPFLDHGAYVLLSDVRLPDVDATARSLLPGKEIVVVTRGSRGATAYLPRGEVLQVPTYDAGPVVDTNGAGDAFCAGMAYGVQRGWDWSTSLRAGAIVAGGCVASPHLCDPGLSEDWLLARL